MTFGQIKHRLSQGRPLVLDSDTGAAFRARGVSLDTPGALGQLLRTNEADVLAHYRAEVQSRVDVLSALTADTTPRALAEVGMQHRAALLTGRAVDLAFEAAADAGKPVAIAGILGSDMVSSIDANRLAEELDEHADRIAAAGCELLVVRGQGSRFGLMAAVTAAARTGLPTWAVVEAIPEGDFKETQYGDLWEDLASAGVNVVLFEVTDIEQAVRSLDSVQSFVDTKLSVGVLLAGSSASVRGFPDEAADVRRWVTRAAELAGHGARVIGGGAGTSEAHTEALAIALGELHPSVPVAGPGEPSS
ncbi:MAG TPA: homocysteine S-methyltransferase family protein [Polyangiaceae bacterium]|nr:homocysteine S-methyltransferase family protein [Polyangiaceae bacterium]